MTRVTFSALFATFRSEIHLNYNYWGKTLQFIGEHAVNQKVPSRRERPFVVRRIVIIISCEYLRLMYCGMNSTATTIRVGMF